MAEQILVTNLAKLSGKRKAEHELYEYVKYEVTPREQFHQCYLAIYEIPPLKSSYPYHYHIANTEAFYIISGDGLLETPDGVKQIRSGDIIVCPSGEEGAHRITNCSKSEPLKYIDFDAIHSPDVIHYPKSGKTGIVIHAESAVFYRDSDGVDYYEGE